MGLETGQTLLHYSLTEKIGEGGMGVVWKARDTELDREVAIKVLPEAFAADADRLARFKREAKVLASLNDPGIAGIYGLHEQDGLRFLAMELVPGEDLSQRIAGGALPVDEALDIAGKIATALAAAHANGIVHRDLKPANVKLTPEHDVKVLDFGLAKPSAADSGGGQADPAMSPTMTSAGSVIGMIMGTAAYMAPEQARGRPVDQRADLWAAGVILFEMLTGRPLFPGEDVSEVLAGVIKSEPDWTALPTDLPRSAHLALRRCLARKPEERLHSAADLRILIGEARREADDATPSAVGAGTRFAWLPWAICAAALIVAFGTWWPGRGGSSPSSAGAVAFQIEAPPGGVLALSITQNFDVTPDGRTVVFAATDADGVRRLFARDLDALAARPIAGTEYGEAPFVAADGTIGFVAQSQLRVTGPGGVGSTAICDIADAFDGGAFAPDGSIVFNDDFDAGLKRVREAGAAVEVLTTPDRDKGEKLHRLPYVLPGGKGVVFTVNHNDAAAAPEGTLETAVLALETGDIKKLASGTDGPYRLLPNGQLLMRRSDRLIALPFDETTLEATGPAVNVFDGNETPVTAFATAGGTLVFTADSLWAGDGMVWLDRDGNESLIAGGWKLYSYPSLSPDGKRVSVSQWGQIWIYDLDQGRRIRLTQEGSSVVPLFAPAGDRVAFGSYQPTENLYWMAADGGAMERLLEADNRQYPLDWDEAGNKLLVLWTDPKNGYDIRTLSLDGGRQVTPLLNSPYNEQWAQLSPDGRWLAYAADESGRHEIYVVSYPDLRGKRAVSIDGGIEPRWSPAGDEIFFKEGRKGDVFRPWSRMMAASVTWDGGAPAFGTPRVLFEGAYLSGPCCGYSYDVAPDGNRFVMSKGVPESKRRLSVMLNAF